MNGESHSVEKWDLIIGFPPCTYLSLVATRAHSLKCTPLEKINQRTFSRIEGMEFFTKFPNLYAQVLLKLTQIYQMMIE